KDVSMKPGTQIGPLGKPWISEDSAATRFDKHAGLTKIGNTHDISLEVEEKFSRRTSTFYGSNISPFIVSLPVGDWWFFQDGTLSRGVDSSMGLTMNRVAHIKPSLKGSSRIDSIAYLSFAA